MWRFLKKLEIDLPYDPAIPLLAPLPHPGGLGFSPDRLISQTGRAGADNVFLQPHKIC